MHGTFVVCIKIIVISFVSRIIKVVTFHLFLIVIVFETAISAASSITGIFRKSTTIHAFCNEKSQVKIRVCILYRYKNRVKERQRNIWNSRSLILWTSTLKFLDSKNESCLSKRLQHQQASVAFFLTFHDATTYMRRPFKYPFCPFWLSKCLFFGMIRNHAKKQAFT